jgi:hypothetical protein
MPRVVAATDSRNPNGIHQKTNSAKKLIPNDATASPRTWAGTSWTSIKADSGPFIRVVSAVRVPPASDKQTPSRRLGSRATGVGGCVES